jgi:hypothetical protein
MALLTMDGPTHAKPLGGIHETRQLTKLADKEQEQRLDWILDFSCLKLFIII